MASIGSYYVRVLPDMSRFTGALTGGMASAGTASGNVFGRTFLGFISRIAIGTTIGRIVTSGFNTIVGGFATGIQRLDIVENYPAILANMGIANEEAEASIERLQTALFGLPTSLQDGVTATQRLTASLGDVDRGTDAFIAFNNALVAGMAPAELQSTALEQFAQAVSKGKPDMLEWRSMLNAMPGQMNQIAQSMGITTDELGEGLRNGTIPMETFLDEIIRLNEEGGEGFASFEEQARTATDTIGTAITNVGNRVAAGWAKIFDVFGQSNIADFINGISSGIYDGFVQVAAALQWLKDELVNSNIGEALSTIIAAIGEFLAPLQAEAVGIVQEFVSGAIDVLSDALTVVADYMPTITDTLSSFVDAAGGVFDTISEIAGGVAEMIGTIDFSPITDFLHGDGEAFAGMMERINQHLADMQPFLDDLSRLWSLFTSAVAELVEAVAPIATEFFAYLGSALVGLAPIVLRLVSGFLMLATGFIEAATAVIEVVVPFLAELVSAIVGVVTIIIQTAINFAANIIGIVTTIVGSVIAFFAKLPGNLANIWNNIKTTASNVWASVRDNVVNRVTSIKTRVTEIFGNLRSSVSTAWTNIKKAITDPINTARDNVQKAINKIKGFFSFSISWPHIPVPYFSITPSGWSIGDLLKGSIPSLSIGWKGTGGMFNGAQLYAVGVGERGAELVWPSYEPYLTKYGTAIAEHINGGNTYYIDGNMVAADAVLAAALETVAQRVSGRSRMGTVV